MKHIKKWDVDTNRTIFFCYILMMRAGWEPEGAPARPAKRAPGFVQDRNIMRSGRVKAQFVE